MRLAEWIALAGAVIGVGGIVFAIYEHRQRAKVESVVRDNLRRLAGVVKVVFSNANWTDLHLRKLGDLVAQTPPDLNAIRQKVFLGARDSAACSRQLSLVHTQIRGIQQTYFNDSEEILPEILSDDVRAAVAQTDVRPSDDKPKA